MVIAPPSGVRGRAPAGNAILAYLKATERYLHADALSMQSGA